MEHLDGQVIILIIFVVISALKWLIEKLKGQGEQPHETSEALEDLYEDFREEIRQRQTTLHEQPPPQQSPPPIPQSTPPVQEIPSVPQATVQQLTAQTRAKKPKLSAEEKAALARFQKRTKSKRRRTHSSHSSVRGMLSSPLSARQAIILTEILGKPKSLRDA